MTWEKLYASSLAAGLLPDQFWSLTFFELAMWRKSIVEREKLEWRRQASLMSLMYNMQRGKNSKKMTATDFFPFDEEKSSGVNSKEDVEALRNRVLENQRKIKAQK